MMKGGLGNLMKQAQQMQADMQKAQEELARLEVVGESGGGMVKVSMNGKHQVLRVEINEDLIGDDKEMLEDLVTAAFNDALTKAESMAADRMSSVAGGMQLPPGFKLPF